MIAMMNTCCSIIASDPSVSIRCYPKQVCAAEEMAIDLDNAFRDFPADCLDQALELVRERLVRLDDENDFNCDGDDVHLLLTNQNWIALREACLRYCASMDIDLTIVKSWADMDGPAIGKYTVD